MLHEWRQRRLEQLPGLLLRLLGRSTEHPQISHPLVAVPLVVTAAKMMQRVSSPCWCLTVAAPMPKRGALEIATALQGMAAPEREPLWERLQRMLFDALGFGALQNVAGLEMPPSADHLLDAGSSDVE